MKDRSNYSLQSPRLAPFFFALLVLTLFGDNAALFGADPVQASVRLDQESTVDAAGNARTELVLSMPSNAQAFIRRLLTQQVVAGQPIEIPLRMKNLLDFFDLDASGSILEDVDGEFDTDFIHLAMREVGFARHQDGRWSYALTSDPSVAYEIVKKERGRIVTVRGVQTLPDGQVSLTQAVITLPEGATDIRIDGNPNQLVYKLPAPDSSGKSKPEFQLEARPHILTALYRLYGDRRFPKLWACRSAFHNDGDETLTDYRVRYRIAGLSPWSPWSRSDVVIPGQTVVDTFRPAINPKVRDLRAPAAATIEVEYEYVHTDGEKVHESRTASTKLLGFNDGVYTDVKLNPDSPWCAVLKGMPLLLASFTSGEDPAMREVADRACKAAGVTPTDGDREAVRFLEAVYNLMRANIEYEPAAGSVIDGVPHQYLKFGRDVLQTKRGTCINTAILYASVAEAAGLEPSIVVVPGHAFVAVRLPKSRQLFFIETTGGTVTANAPFAEACKVATSVSQKAAQSGLFMMFNIGELRAKGVRPPKLASIGEDVFTHWNIVSPDESTTKKNSAPRQVSGAAPAATILAASKDPDVVRNGLKGMAFKVQVRIRNARGLPCELYIGCLDENHRLVRSDLEGYSTGGVLVHVIRLTPKSDDQEWEDLELFLPYSGMGGGTGTHHITAIIGVGSDGKSLTDAATLVPFTITRNR